MIYIAGPFFNEKQVNFINQIEKALNKNRLEYFSPRSEGVLLSMSEEDKAKSKRDIYESNIGHIKDASLMVAVIDDRDVGTIWEMGYGTALGIPIISISNHSYGLNVMLAESVSAHVLSIEEMLVAIHDPDYKGQLIKGIY